MANKFICSALIFAALAGCEYTDSERREMAQRGSPSEVVIGGNSRVSVERIDVISDGLAYGQKRGVYIIRDKESGKEFIGVSGIGIQEVGSHSEGKNSRVDER